MTFANLNKNLNTYSKSSRKTSKRSKIKKLLLIFFVVIIVLSIAVYFPARSAYSAVLRMNVSAKALSASVKEENLDLMINNLQDIRQAEEDLSNSLFWLSWVKVIPFVGGYYSDGEHFLKATGYELEAMSILTNSLKPYENELGLNGTSSAPNNDRVAQIVQILDKVIPQLDSIEPQLKKASLEVQNIDTSKYPETFRNFKLKSNIEMAKNYIVGINNAVTESRAAIEIIPSSLGQPMPKTYMLVFQNDKELRATGGFMTAYSYMKFDKGRMTSATSDDIYTLDDQIQRVCGRCLPTPPAPILKYLPEQDGQKLAQWRLRDSNLSPDVPTSMQQFERMYKLLGAGLPFDGIILIDTNVLADLIKITGPVVVAGTTYSADIDKRCDCSSVVYELENYTQVVEKGGSQRKAVLGSLMQEILVKLLSTPTAKMPDLLNTGIKLANSKDIVFYMHDEKSQQALTDLGWAGAIKETESDYLHINDSNFAGGKSNLNVIQEVTLDINSQNLRVITHNLTIKYDYPKPNGSASWLKNTNRNYFRVYLPKDSKLISSKGSEVVITKTNDDFSKSVYQGFFELRMSGSKTVKLEYETTNKGNDKSYPLLIQKQPGTRPFKYTVKVNGKTQKEFLLDSDKQLNLSL